MQFDENSIFNYLADEEIIGVDDTLTFNDIKKYITLDNREMETFLFFKADAFVEELNRKIESEFNNGRRVGIAFMTATGKQSESLQGIITPWDIIALSK